MVACGTRLVAPTLGVGDLLGVAVAISAGVVPVPVVVRLVAEVLGRIADPRRRMVLGPPLGPGPGVTLEQHQAIVAIGPDGVERLLRGLLPHLRGRKTSDARHAGGLVHEAVAHNARHPLEGAAQAAPEVGEPANREAVGADREADAAPFALDVVVAEVVDVEDDLEARVRGPLDRPFEPAQLRPVQRASERGLYPLPSELEPDQLYPPAREVVEGRPSVVVVGPVVAAPVLFGEAPPPVEGEKG